jgi:RimJ/RimL family protein N-acetyltransferase
VITTCHRISTRSPCLDRHDASWSRHGLRIATRATGPTAEEATVATDTITPLHPTPGHGRASRDRATPTADDDTLRVWFTPARPADADALHDLYERLSPIERRLRFFGPMPTVPRSIATHLCSVDPTRHAVVLARRGSPTGPVVAEVQVALDQDDPSRAELALAVDSRWSGRGLGRALVAIAHQLADDLGVETLTGEVLAENRRCVDLLIRAGMRFSVASGVLVGVGPVVPTGPVPSSATFAARREGLAATA